SFPTRRASDLTHAGSDQNPANGVTPAGATNVNACADEQQIDGLLLVSDDETALESAYSDGCGTVSETFVSQVLSGDNCSWSLERSYTISDGCSANDFTVTITHAGSDQNPANGVTPAGATNVNACADEQQIDGLLLVSDDETA